MSMFRYILAVSPILIANLIIPPLSHYEGKESSFDFLLLYLTPERFRELSIKNRDRIKKELAVRRSTPYYCYKHITHAFIHNDNEHLIDNLIGIFICSYPVYRTVGMRALNLIYISGAYAASMSTPLISTIYKFQEECNIASFENYGSLQGTIIANFIPYYILSWIDYPLRKIARSIGSLFIKDADFYALGASGVIYFINGINLTFALRDSLFLFDMLKNLSIIKEKKVSMLSYLISLFTSYHLVSEFDHVNKQFVQKQSCAQNYDNIGHASHIQGSIFGVMVGIIYLSKGSTKYLMKVK